MNGRTASGIVYYWRGVALVLVIAVVCFCLLSHTLLLEHASCRPYFQQECDRRTTRRSSYTTAPQYPVCSTRSIWRTSNHIVSVTCISVRPPSPPAARAHAAGCCAIQYYLLPSKVLGDTSIERVRPSDDPSALCSR